jgi:hypothetical protein
MEPQEDTLDKRMAIAQEMMDGMREDDRARAAIAAQYPTLRDQFAMAALTGMLSTDDRTADGNYSIFYARLAYEVADAMLEARKEN